MRDKVFKAVGLVYCVLMPFAEGVANTTAEHERLATTAFDNTLTAISATTDGQAITIPLGNGDNIVLPNGIWRDLGFAEATAHFARDDRAGSRFHRRGQTIQAQLGAIAAADLEAALQRLLADTLAVDVVTQSGDGVVANYFRYHWLALRYARMAAASPDQRESLLRRGLVLEAVAQGFLADTFAAGHLMPPKSGVLSFVHPNNSNRLHDSYATSGVFVIDSRHQVWLTFGDGVLFWHPKAMGRVLATCEVSLREFFVGFYANLSPGAMPSELTAWLAEEFPGHEPHDLAANWLTAHDGPQYYKEMRLASLTRLPMPIAATWSVRTGEEDEHGISVRKHYPQTREPGSFDPTLTSHEFDALYARRDLPDWLRLPLLAEKTPREIISFEKDVAAPIFVQDWRREPSIIGGVLTGGVAYLRAGAGNSTYATYGVGIGLSDQLMHVEYLPSLTQVFFQLNLKDEIDGRQRLFAGSIVMRVHMPGIVNLLLETGVNKGIQGAMNRAGPLLAVGLTSRTVTLPGLYVGAQLRTRYEASFLEEITHGLQIEVVLF